MAIYDYDEIIRLDPKYAHAYFDWGYAYASKQDFDAAIRDYTSVIQLDPKNPDAYSGRGCAYGAKQDFDEAIKDYTEAIRLNLHIRDFRDFENYTKGLKK